MSRPLDNLSDASSSTAAEKAVSTLRARLCSEDPYPAFKPSSSSESYPKPHDIYRQLRTTFSSASGPPPLHGSDAGATIMDNLAETFARSGEEAYRAATCDLQAVHASVATEIDALHGESASTLRATAALYNNVTHPLAATICHSRNFPRGTIEKHLQRLKAEIAAADAALSSLNQEWTACIQEEAQLAMARQSGDEAGVDGEMEGFLAEIDAIVRDGTADLEQMNKEYRDLLWAESHKMMQAMMAD